jgi:hypothetical protein
MTDGIQAGADTLDMVLEPADKGGLSKGGPKEKSASRAGRDPPARRKASPAKERRD